jgi:acetolactate synthase, small subunit
VLARVSGILGGRGYNIDSLCVNTTMSPETSKIVLTTTGDQITITKIEKQLNKLVDVLQVADLTEDNSVQSELALIRMKLTKENKPDILKAVETFKARILIMEPVYCVIELSGKPDELEGTLAHLKPLGIEDTVRTGAIALKK